MREHSNTQSHVLVVGSPNGKMWVVGTNTQRGFTEGGAEHALRQLEPRLPRGWSLESAELFPLDEALAVRGPRVV